MGKRITVRELVRGAAIAAAYVVLTLISYPIAYGPVQVRLSEALCVLPLFTPTAIYGLFAGCFLSNLLGNNGIWDVVIGSLTTLLCAFLGYRLRGNVVVAILPAVVLNALIIGAMLHVLYAEPAILAMGTVGLGQLIACYGLGLPLHAFLKRNPKWLLG